MNSLEEYGALFQKLGLSELVVEEGDCKLKLKKEVFSQEVKKTDTEPLSEKPQEIKTKTAKNTIKAPLLGIFYSSCGGKEPVKEGDIVKEGDVLCMIEAMKMMNEVKATKSGVIERICAKDGDLVEYNQDLFVVA